jgi:hypothetical protein
MVDIRLSWADRVRMCSDSGPIFLASIFWPKAEAAEREHWLELVASNEERVINCGEHW